MANIVKKYSISSELAQKMVDAAVAKARELGVSENVAILDDGGNLKAFSRMDRASMPTIEIAQKKAYTALFGVSSSSGEVPTSIEEMAANAIAFIRALGLAKVDVLGFSIGGFVAQEIAGQAPGLVRKLVLVGTGPRGGEGMASLTPEAQQIFGASYEEPDHLWLAVHFTRSQASQAAGRGFLKRFRLRKENRDPEVNEKVAPAQLEALGRWGIQFKGSYDYLKAISQPTLVVNGGKDVIVYSVNSFILQQHLPNAQLILYPDANHGSQYQYPELFVRHVSMFLSANER